MTIDEATMTRRVKEAAEVAAPRPSIPPVIRRARRLRARRMGSVAVSAAILVVAVTAPIAVLRHIGEGGASPGDRATLSGSGISAWIPAGWNARIEPTPGLGGATLEVTTEPLPAPREAFGSVAWSQSARHGGTWLWVQEVTRLCPCEGFARASSVPAFRADDWLVPDPRGSDRETRIVQNEGGYLRALTIGGRSFVVEALFQRRPAPAAELATVNRILSSIRVAPSSPPVTEAAPVSFDPGAGITAWSAARRSPSSAWASSVTLDPRDLYQTGIDGTLVWSPAYTLAHLPSDGVVITAMRWRTHTPAIGPLSVDPTGHLSADLTTARPERHWEGRPAPDLVAYRIEGTLGPDLADVRVYLHAHPAPGTLRRAQAMLDRLRFAAPLKD